MPKIPSYVDLQPDLTGIKTKEIFELDAGRTHIFEIDSAIVDNDLLISVIALIDRPPGRPGRQSGGGIQDWTVAIWVSDSILGVAENRNIYLTNRRGVQFLVRNRIFEEPQVGELSTLRILNTDIQICDTKPYYLHIQSREYRDIRYELSIEFSVERFQYQPTDSLVQFGGNATSILAVQTDQTIVSGTGILEIIGQAAIIVIS